MFPTRSTSIKSKGHHDTINEVTRVVVVHTWENTKTGRLSRRSISYTLSHSRIPTKSTLQQISTVRSMSWQAELFLIVDPSLLQVLISLIIITSLQGSSSRGEWTSYFHFSVISRRTDNPVTISFILQPTRGAVNKNFKPPCPHGCSQGAWCECPLWKGHPYNHEKVPRPMESYNRCIGRNLSCLAANSPLGVI